MDGREIYLHYHSKGESVRQCTRSHAPFQVHIRENLIRFIGNFRATFYPSKNKKFNVDGDCGSNVGYKDWNRNYVNGHNKENPYGQAHENGYAGGLGRGDKVRGSGQDRNHSGVGGAQGGPGPTPAPPTPTRTYRDIRVAVRTVGREGGR